MSLDRHRVAVLPLENLSPDPNDEYFADGLTEELISTISNVSGLSVISRTSVKQYKKTSKKLAEIGQDLGAGTILEGSVRKAGNKIRVAVQLIEVEEDKHLWAQNYDRDLQDVFAVQSDIAERVAKALEVKVLGEERQRLESRGSRNTDALTLYMKGRSFYEGGTEPGIRKAIEYLEGAVREDPNFALAYVGLADCYYWLAGDYIGRAEGQSKAKQNLNKALHLNPDLGEAHAVLGLWLTLELSWQEAENECRKGLELSPSNAHGHSRYALLLNCVGRLDEALREARRALELDPISPQYGSRVGEVLYNKRDYDGALDQFKQVLRTEPNYPYALIWMGFVYLSKSMPEEALEWVLKWKEGEGDYPRSPGFTKGMVAYFYAHAGRREEAITMFNQAFESDPGLTPIAHAHFNIAIGNIDVAFEFLEKAYDARDPQLYDLKVFPLFDPIRSDPRFTALVQKLNLA